MTQTQQHCSTPDQLLTFLRGQLSSQEESELQLHLNDCVVCRERLEDAAADADAWNEARQFFGSGALRESSDDSTGGHEEATQSSQQIRQVLDTLAPTDDPESLGRIGGYEVTGVVGAGGMGVVLKAHDRSLDRIVAVKVMSPHLASSGSARKRFAREAKAAAAVLHPNVIAIHSVASEDANPYLVMPYVRGASLQKRIDSQGPLPLKDTLRIGAQIAAGLAAAHEQGLVHRDIKPANILLEEGVERVTITDFGLARAVDDASMTCSGVIAGTPQYMSPEQGRGEPIDARSDLFSLGSVLYAVCAGRSPFRAETTYGVLHRIANDRPAPVCEVNSDVPVWLGHLIERLMAKRPEDRFESAAQVAELLEGCLAHVQQPAAIPLPVGVQALAAQTQRRAADIPKPNRLKAIHQRIPPFAKFIAAAAGGVALFFTGILIVLELGKGTLTIESEIDDVPIRVMQGEDVAKTMKLTKGETSVRIASGVYVVEIDGEFDSVHVDNGNVSLRRGDQAVVKIIRSRTQMKTQDSSDVVPLKNTPPSRTTATELEEALQWRSLTGVSIRQAPDFTPPRGAKFRGAVLVSEVEKNSPAHVAGIRANDYLIGVGTWETNSIEGVEFVATQIQFGKLDSTDLKFYVVRNSQILLGHLKLNIDGDGDGDRDIRHLMEHIANPAMDELLNAMNARPAAKRDWETIKSKALTISEVGNLLLRGQRDQSEWGTFSESLRDHGKSLFEASQSQDAVVAKASFTAISESCTNCHRVYRNRPNASSNPIGALEKVGGRRNASSSSSSHFTQRGLVDDSKRIQHITVDGQSVSSQELVLQVEETRHNKQLVWATKIKQGTFRAWMTKDHFPISERKSVPGFWFQVSHGGDGQERGYESFQYKLSASSSLPDAIIYFDKVKAEECELRGDVSVDSLRVATVKFPDGTEGGILLSIRAALEDPATDSSAQLQTPRREIAEPHSPTTQKTVDTLSTTTFSGMNDRLARPSRLRSPRRRNDRIVR